MVPCSSVIRCHLFLLQTRCIISIPERMFPTGSAQLDSCELDDELGDRGTISIHTRWREIARKFLRPHRTVVYSWHS